jgi:hypothetical protein
MNYLGIFLRIVLVTSAVLGFCTGARADDADAGAYLGANFGRAHNTYDTGFIDSELATAVAGDSDTATYRARSTQRMSDVWWADGGYLFNPYVGIEAAFFHLGEIKYWAVGTLTTPIGGNFLSTKSDISSKGPALSLVLRLPLTSAFEADLRVGDYYGKTTANTLVTFNSTSVPNSTTKSSSSLLVGVGAAYTIAAHWSLRADLLRVNNAGDSSSVGTFSVNLVTLGASFTF